MGFISTHLFFEQLGGWRRVAAEHHRNSELKAKADAHYRQYGDGAKVVTQVPGYEGWTLRQLTTQADYKLEGDLMQNCIRLDGSFNSYPDVHSLRTEENIPVLSLQLRHRTLQDYGHFPERGNPVDSGSEVVAVTQVKQRQNDDPMDEYMKPLTKALVQHAKDTGATHIYYSSYNGGNGKLWTVDEAEKFSKRINGEIDETEETRPDVFARVPYGYLKDAYKDSKDVEHATVEVPSGGGGSGRRRNQRSLLLKMDPQDGSVPFKKEEDEKYHIIRTPWSKRRFENGEHGRTAFHASFLGGTWDNSDIKIIDRVKEIPGSAVQVISRYKPKFWSKSEVKEMTTCPSCGKEVQSQNWNRWYAFQPEEGRCGSCDMRAIDDDNFDTETRLPKKLFVNVTGTEWRDKHHSCPSCRGQGTVDINGEETTCRTCQGAHRLESVVEKMRPFEGYSVDFSLNPHGWEPDHKDYENTILSVPFSEDIVGKDVSYYDDDKDHTGWHLKDNGAFLRSNFTVEKEAHIPKKTYIAVDSKHRDNPWVYGPEGLETTFVRAHFSDSADRTAFAGSNKNDIYEVDMDALPKDIATTHKHGVQGYGKGRGDNLPSTHNWEPDTRIPIPYTAMRLIDKSELNKRKKMPFDESGEYHLEEVAKPERPKEFYLFSSMRNMSIKGIRDIEAGNVPEEALQTDELLATNPGETLGSTEFRVNIKDHPDYIEDLTPTRQQMREKRQYVGGRRIDFNSDNIPSTDPSSQAPYFKLKDGKPGEGQEISVTLGQQDEGAQSIIPTNLFLHVPKHMRGDDTIYGEDGINMNNMSASWRQRYERDASRMLFSDPLSLEHQHGREPVSEMDVWALDPDKIPDATLAREKYGDRPATFHAPDVIPWDAVTRLHRKPIEPITPSIRKFFESSVLEGWKHLSLMNVRER